MKTEEKIMVARRESNEEAFDEFTLEECEKMHEATGMVFVCGDGVIKEIYD